MAGGAEGPLRHPGRRTRLLVETFAHGTAAFPGRLSLRGPAGAHHPGHAADPAAGPAGRRAAGLSSPTTMRSGVWSLEPMDRLDFDALFQEDMLGDDLEAWLEESFMMKRAFRQCALISGLIERRFPRRGEVRPPGHLLQRPDLRRAAPPPAGPPAAEMRARRRGQPACWTWRGWAIFWPASRGASACCNLHQAVAVRRADADGDRPRARARPGPDMVLEAAALNALIDEAHGVSAPRAPGRPVAVAASPCGGGAPAAGRRRRRTCGRSGALWLEAARTLVVADLHLEKGSAYRRPRPAAAALRHRRDPGAAGGRGGGADPARWSCCWATASTTAGAEDRLSAADVGPGAASRAVAAGLGGRQPRRRRPARPAGEVAAETRDRRA